MARVQDPPPPSELIVVYGHVFGKRSKILIDIGATTSFVSEAFIRLHHLRTTARSKPLKVYYADGRDEVSNRLLADTPLVVGGMEEQQTFEIANIKYDCILGKSWHDDHRAVIRMPQDVVEFEKDGKHFHIQSIYKRKLGGPMAKIDPVLNALMTEESKIEVVSSKQMEKIIKRGREEVFAISVKNMEDDTSSTPLEYQQDLRRIQEGYEYIFQESIPREVTGKPRGIEHEIEIAPGSAPPVLPIYRMTQHELQVLKGRIQELLDKGHIQPSSSPYAASALFAPKKNGDLRLCIDYRLLNKQTVKNRYPLPLIDELLDRLQPARFFSKLDLSDGYYHIPIKKEDRQKTAFRTPYGHYEFVVMPFGLANAPATFQRMMNDILRDYVNDFVVVYLDDIMIYSKTKEEHEEHLRKVFAKLKEHSLFVKPSKSFYFQKEIEYLGYVIKDGKVLPAADKVKAITEWPTPLPSMTAVRSFLGMAQFYKRFVKNFAAIAKPLTDLTKSTQEFQWNEKAEKAVNELKGILAKLPEMHLPDVSKPFILRTDSSQFAIGAVLSQKFDNKEYPVAYFNRKLRGDIDGRTNQLTGEKGPTGELAYRTHEQELLAVHDALQKWRHYLLGSDFQIFTDHHPLRFFMTQKRLSPRQARWAEFIGQFELEINHIPGKSNTVADALSRRSDFQPQEGISLANIETAIEDIDDDVKEAILEGYKEESKYGDLEYDNELQEGGAKWLKVKSGWIWRKNEKGPHDQWRIIVPKAAVDKVLRRAHNGTIGACQGTEKMCEYIRRSFTWKGMVKDIEKFVSSCVECGRNKNLVTGARALLQPLPIPDSKWTHLSMDFITNLPETLNGDDAIFVVVDRLTKQAHFIVCKTTATAKDIAQLFIEQVWRLHGIPKNIVSDRDSKFISKFWEELMRMLGIQRTLSSAYHPETDGQTERTNRSLEQILRHFCAHQQRRWAEFLPHAEFAYNNAKHSTTGVSPFFANYGHHPRTDFPDMGDGKNQYANDFVQRMRQIERSMKETIAMAQQRQAHQANKHRREREFKEGDWVFLSTSNLSVMTLTKKLAPRYVGPMKVTKKISRTAYEIDIPKSWKKIHNVFYVGLLKPFKGEEPTEPVQIPPLVQETEEFEVEDIRSHRQSEDGLQFLVKWRGYAEEENTWQSRGDLANAPRILANYFARAGLAGKNGHTLQDHSQQYEGTVETSQPLQEDGRKRKENKSEDSRAPDQRQQEESDLEKRRVEKDAEGTSTVESRTRPRREPTRSRQWDDFVRF